jgi:CheY-like chemotaxis protein
MNSNPLNILLADDDIDDCNFFKEAIKELDLSSQLTIVNDGEQLMKRLSDETIALPDIVFLDNNMPRKNGLECLYEMKQHKRLKDLPVVMFSTSGSHETISVLFNAGAHVYIRKPGDISELKQVIHHALPMASEKMFSKHQVKYILNA